MSNNQSDPFARLDWYIAFPQLGRNVVPRIGRNFVKQVSGPMKGRHIFINPKTKQSCFTKAEFDDLYPRVLEEYQLIRETRAYPHPVPVVLVKEPAIGVDEPVEEPDIPAPKTEKMEKAWHEQAEPAKPDAASDFSDLYEAGDIVSFQGDQFEVYEVAGSKADCFALTEKGNRRVSKGKPVMREIDLSQLDCDDEKG